MKNITTLNDSLKNKVFVSSDDDDKIIFNIKMSELLKQLRNIVIYYNELFKSNQNIMIKKKDYVK